MLINPHETYVVLTIDNEYVMVGKITGTKNRYHIKKVVYEGPAVHARELIAHNSQVYHPFNGTLVPIIGDASVDLQEGTAFVHCAPGAGPIDYEIGIKNNLDIYSPVSSGATIPRILWYLSS